jgi:hypothetical protein
MAGGQKERPKRRGRSGMRAVSRHQNLWVGWLGYALYFAPFDDLEVEIKD